MDTKPNNFLRQLIGEDLAAGRYTAVRTRFPPEPNGYLHIGHAKSICLNFGLSQEFPGRTHLRFDDTNPAKEEQEYVDAIQADVRWLGFDWGEHLYYASDFFDRMYQLGEKLIRDGKAYVCGQTDEQMRVGRGSVEEPGTPSPWRDAPPLQSLDLFRRMRAGDFPDGAYTLRARIDMSAANMKLRDPPLYRIRHATHQQTGDAWCIYPMYDYAHPLCDAFEGITHSICTLEFENNRDLYDWVIEATGVQPVPHQYEFVRLQLNYTVLSKRKLIQLVQDGCVRGWDDPRMPTIAGLRRRGVRPSAIREFAERVGVAKANSVVDLGLLEHVIRDDLNPVAPRYLAVLDPLPVEIVDLDAPVVSEAPRLEGGPTRPLRLTRHILVDRGDFAEVPPPGWHRLAPGRVVRLRHGGLLRCDEVVREGDRVVGLRASRPPEGGKVPGTIQWVSADDAVSVEVRLYERLFAVERPDAEGDFRAHLNPESLVVVTARAEAALGALGPGVHVQLERLGYFYTDPADSRPGAPVLNRVVSLKDGWAKVAPKQAPAEAPARPAAPAAPPRVLEVTEAMRPFVTAGVGAEAAAVLAAEPATARVYDAAVAHGAPPAEAARWLATATSREQRTALKPDGRALAALVSRVADGTLSSRLAREVWAEMLETGDGVDAIVARTGVTQVSDRAALAAVVAEVVQANPDKLAAWRAGKTALAGFFVGEVMKRTKGAANPKLVQELVVGYLAT